MGLLNQSIKTLVAILDLIISLIGMITLGLILSVMINEGSCLSVKTPWGNIGQETCNQIIKEGETNEPKEM